jgi:hypothetical protein
MLISLAQASQHTPNNLSSVRIFATSPAQAGVFALDTLQVTAVRLAAALPLLLSTLIGLGAVGWRKQAA